MDDDPMEGTSQLFASLLGDVSAEQWESFKEESKHSGLIIPSDSEDESDVSEVSSCLDLEQHVTNIELIEEEENVAQSESSDEESKKSNEATWGYDAAIKYVHGKISFSELNSIMEEKIEIQPKKRQRLDDNAESREESAQIAKEAEEYQAELKNKRKQHKKQNRLPKELGGLMGAANLSFAKGDLNDAMKMCMELIRQAPNAQEPFQTLGVIYDELGETLKAFQYYLVAAYLDPSDTDEWLRLADLSLEQNQIQQAISCYSHAIRNEPANVNLLWERCNLYEQLGERRRALDGYERILKHLSNPEDAQKCVDIARDLAKVHHENTDCANAIAVLDVAFTKFPSLVTSEDVNFLLELQLGQKMYKNAMKNFILHCGVKLYLHGNEISSLEELNKIKDEDYEAIEECYVPEVLPIDLAVKILVCLIHLKSKVAIKPLLESLKRENADEIGDLFLDVAEALMESKENELSKSLLELLLSKSSFNLPAVWMKYADTLEAMGLKNESKEAYCKVIEMASFHEARAKLSNILIDQGKTRDAINALKQEYENGDKSAIIDAPLLYRRCKLLEAEENWDEFIPAAILLQYCHCFPLETEEEFNITIANQSSRRRIDAIRELKLDSNRPFPEFTPKKVPKEDLMYIMKLLSAKLFQFNRFEELQNVSLSLLTSNLFLKAPDMIKEFEFQAFLSCFFNRNFKYSYKMAKELVVKNLHNTKVWNLFCLVVTYCQEMRHNRFCLRLMMKHQDHLALGYFNGHNAMICGTYKHALGEYMCILKEHPKDSFIHFCVGITFIHMASQKFTSKRHLLTIQGFAFLQQYLKLKGECQETFFNIGRALHQLGIKDAAVQFYKKALCSKIALAGPDKETYDLSREIAYNISLIYQSSGATNLAYMYQRKYIVI